jgi:branched-chain amino acid transport system substrate-binding protein
LGKESKVKRIIAILLVVVFIAAGLGGSAYAQSSGHEPMTGQKLIGTADMGKIDSGQVRRVFLPNLRIFNPDCFADITVERMFIIAEDGDVLYDGPFLRTPTSAPGGPPEVMTRPLKPHEAWECFLPACIPDGEGGWLPVNQVLNHPRTICTVEIFWSGAGNGCPLVGEVTELSRLVNRQTGDIISEATSTSALERLEQVLAPPPPKESIVIGASRPLSGANQPIGDAALGPLMEMWQEEVNADGGIYVAEYGKKLPVEFIIYDDTSDVATMAALTEKLILEDKVDILLSACGTEMIAAQAPIANKYGYVLITAEGADTGLREVLPGLPYVFVSLPYSENYQLPVLADMLAAEGAETAYIVSVATLHGIEYAGMAAIEFGRVGIDVIANVSVPITETNFEPIVQDAKAADPDVFCCFCYPPIILPITGVSMGLGFNPDAFICGPGGNFGFYAATFGAEAVEGVTTFAAANEETSPEFAQLFSDLEARIGYEFLDYWGQPYYRAVLQIWQQAIEATGTLDQDVLRDYIATATFDTILGPTWFETIGGGGGLLAKECHPGEIGQWQSGVCEIVGGGPWPATVLTGDFIYPKPPWPGTPPQNNQAHANFNTSWRHHVSGDSFSNAEVTGTKTWNTLVINQADATGAPLTGVNLRLDSGLVFDDVGVSNGTLVTEGPPVYEWSFGDVAEGPFVYDVTGAWVGFWDDPHPFPVTFTPGFDASRIADQTTFLQSGGTQTLTISVTPREQSATENLTVSVVVPIWVEDLVDAFIQPPTGVDFTLSPDGKQLWMGPTGLTVGEEWTVTVNIQLTPNVPQIEFMPIVELWWGETLDFGNIEGNSVSHPTGDPADGVGSWTWSATGEGALAWNWGESVTRNVVFDFYCWEYQE